MQLGIDVPWLVEVTMFNSSKPIATLICTYRYLLDLMIIVRQKQMWMDFHPVHVVTL